MFDRSVPSPGLASKRGPRVALVLGMAVAIALSLFPGASAETLASHPDGNPSWVAGNLGSILVPDEANGPEAFLQELVSSIEPSFRHALAQSFGGTGAEEFEIASLRVEEGTPRVAHLALRQRFSGLEVVGAGFRARIDLDQGHLMALNGRFYPTRPDYDLEAVQLQHFETAFANALTELEGSSSPLEGHEPIFFADGAALEIAYRALVELGNGNGPEWLYLRATDGRLLATEPLWLPAAAPDRDPWWKEAELLKQEIRTRTGLAQQATPPFDWMPVCHSRLLVPIIAKPSPWATCSWDDSIKRAHSHATKVFRYFQSNHGWSSYDDKYSILDSTAHFHQYDGSGAFVPVANAYWDLRNKRMYYGDGDSEGEWLLDLTLGFDVGAHEMTHGVTQETSGLVYRRESGAINEAMSDIFAAAAEAWDDGAISTDTWLLGEDVAGPSLGAALRFMSNPTADGYSSDYYPERLWPDPCTPTSSNDYCGVHGNSGIANLAFYLLVEGGSHPRSKTSTIVPAIGMDKAAKIYFAAQHLLNPSDGFDELRLATESAAASLYDPATEAAVSKSWEAVGVLP